MHNNHQPPALRTTYQATSTLDGQILLRGGVRDIARSFGLNPHTLSNWINGKAPQPSDLVAQGKAPQKKMLKFAGIRFERVQVAG